jgi:hypothetical protein
MESYNQILTILQEAGDDVVKFGEKGNKAAGKRLRKALLEIGKLTKTARQEIQAVLGGE